MGRAARRADAPVAGREGRRPSLRALVALLAVVPAATIGVVGLVAPSTSAAGATFVVDSTGDEADRSPGDGICNTVAPPAARCTLRAAIEEANAVAGHDTIRFSITGSGPHRIRPATDYERLDDPAGVTIDGYSQPGAVVNTAGFGSNAVLRVELRGTGPSGIDGLDLRSPGNVVRGLALFDFKRHIRLYGPSSSGNLIVGNFIGTDATGTFRAAGRAPSGADGVHLQEGAHDNEIGTPALADRNVISGTADRGIGMYDPGTSDNRVQNNLIGLAPNGTTPLGNWSHGIDVNWGASDNLIGGGGGAGNVISANSLSGVEISHGTSTARNRVAGNLVGTDASGSVTGPTLANGEIGVGLEGEGVCVSVCLPDIHDNEVTGNVIVGGDAAVVIWKGAHDNLVADNHLGVLADGTTGSGTDVGVAILGGAFDNLVEDNRIARVRIGVTIRPSVSFASGPVRTATFGNELRGNSIEHTTQLGIDLAPEGPVTDVPAADVQEGVAIPTIVAVTTDDASVSGCAGCLVELFETEVLPTGYPNGSGRRSLGTANASGGVAAFVFRTSVTDPWVVEAGRSVSATVTTPGGSTSEFSARVVVGAGTIGPPVPTSSTSSTSVPSSSTSSPSTSTPTSTSVPRPTTTSTVAPPATARPSAGKGASAGAPAARCSLSAAC